MGPCHLSHTIHLASWQEGLQTATPGWGQAKSPPRVGQQWRVGDPGVLPAFLPGCGDPGVLPALHPGHGDSLVHLPGVSGLDPLGEGVPVPRGAPRLLPHKEVWDDGSGKYRSSQILISGWALVCLSSGPEEVATRAPEQGTLQLSGTSGCSWPDTGSHKRRCSACGSPGTTRPRR